MSRPDPMPDEAGLRLLFVCSGNTCRSPLAEILALAGAEQAGLHQMEVRSAGTHAQNGYPASDGAGRVARRHGHSLDAHRSQALSRELVDWADYIFTMGPHHQQIVEAMGGEGKTFLLGAFATGGHPSGDASDAEDLSVPDPFGGNDQVYEETFLKLGGYVQAALRRLAEEAAP